MPRAKLRTYDAACEELGGRPWLPKPEATDRWFLADARGFTPPQSIPAIPDTAGFDLRKRMSVTTKLCIAAAALLAAIAAVAVYL